MSFQRQVVFWLVALAVGFLAMPVSTRSQSPPLPYRWLFVWRDLSDPKEVDAAIADIDAVLRRQHKIRPGRTDGLAGSPALRDVRGKQVFDHRRGRRDGGAKALDGARVMRQVI